MLGNGVGIPNGRLPHHRQTQVDAALRRRSSALLELDEGFQNSIQRAADALDASRRSRVEAELRAERGRTRSAHFVVQEVRGHERELQDTIHEEGEQHQTRTRKLKKARSVDVLSPRYAHHATNNNNNRNPTHEPITNNKYATVSPSSASLAPPPHRSARRTVSTSHLALPVCGPSPTEPSSKFSASTGNSHLDSPLSHAEHQQQQPSRPRAKTLNHMHSLRNLLRATPSKLSLRTKGSLASLFSSANEHKDSSASQQRRKDAAAFKQRVTRIPTRSSGTPSPTSSHGTTRTFFRRVAGLGDSRSSTASSSDAGHSERRSSSEDSGARKWAGRISRVVSGLKAPTPPPPSPVIVRLAEKVQAENLPTRTASRIPISAIFADSTNLQRASVQSTQREPAIKPRPRPRAVYSPTREELSDSASPLGLPRVRPVHRKPHLAQPSTRPLSLVGAKPKPKPKPEFAVFQDPPKDVFPDPFPAPAPAAAVAAPPRLPFKRPSIPPTLSLLPAAQLRPRPASTANARPLSTTSTRASTRPQSLTLDVLTDSSSSSGAHTPPSPSPNRRSFRSPSPARFRDLLPSPSASSSPEKTADGLPAPNVSPKSEKRGGSPKKLAMGPEQIIEMEASNLGPEASISEVCGATSDLADLLSALGDDDDATRGDLTKSLQQHLPRQQSNESMHSTVSDVPDDLRRLIQSVADHIEDKDLYLANSDVTDEIFDDVQAIVDSDADTNALVEYYAEDEHTGELFARPTSSGALLDPLTSTYGDFGPTASSFEGHVSTAAMALRSMLDGPGPGEQEPRYTRPINAASFQDDDELERPRVRDSVQEYLEMERPSVGDKMMDRMDKDVSLTSLIHGPPSPEQPRPASGRPQTQRADSTSSSGSCSIMGSPTPANGLRRSIMRYSADASRIRAPAARPISVQSESSTGSSGSDFDRPPSPPQDATSTSLQTIGSANSSPCAGPRRRVPMLTRNPIQQPAFRFPPPKKPLVTNQGGWAPRESTPEKTRPAKDASPFKKAFSPLEQFRMKARGVGSGDNVELDVEGSNSSESPGSSPRFVRPLHPSKSGSAIPRPRPLSSSSTSNALIPPDTPPPSSPSASDTESKRSSHSSLSSFRSAAIDIDPPTQPISTRSLKGHSRQLSLASSVIQETILEERESPQNTPAVARTLHPGLSPIVERLSPAGSSIGGPASPGVPSDIVVHDDDESEEEMARFEAAQRPRTFNLTFSRHDEPERDLVEYLDESDLDDFGEDGDDLMRSFKHYAYEADQEIARSQALWPDTEVSLEAMARFNAPKGWHDILQFLFDSQNRFCAAPPPSSYLPTTRAFYLHDNATSAFPEAELVPLDFSDAPSPSPERGSPPGADVSLSPPSPTRVATRRPLGAKLLNRQLVLTQSSSSPRNEDALSPFTALPPKLTGKLRGLRARLSPSPKKKTVDVAFLGSAAKTTRRRKTQWDAARRRLEGVGDPDEQMSGDESDTTEDTGVLEAAGEGFAFMSFVKTPKLSTSRPRVRRKPGLTHLR